MSWNQYDALFAKYATQYSIKPEWLKAIAINESSLGEDDRVKRGLVSRDGKSWGLMQLELPTASDLLEREVEPKDLNDPETSICAAAKYLRCLLEMFDGNLRKAVMAYNEGPGNMRKGIQSDGAKAYYVKFANNLTYLKGHP